MNVRTYQDEGSGEIRLTFGEDDPNCLLWCELFRSNDKTVGWVVLLWEKTSNTDSECVDAHEFRVNGVLALKKFAEVCEAKVLAKKASEQ